MIEHIKIESISSEEVSLIVDGEKRPVFANFLGAENQNTVISQLVVLDNRQGFERFSKANAIGNNTAVVLFDLVNCPEYAIMLKPLEFTPNESILNASSGLDDLVFFEFANVLTKDVV